MPRTAQINTVTVTLKVIQVDKKQMTLSVFKQLPMKEAINKDAVWGWVKCRNNFYLVWSDGEMLYKDVVSYNGDDDAAAPSFLSEFDQLFIAV